LAAASEQFSSHGYAGTSIRAIVGQAGANVSAVNYHFGSKEDLFLATLERPLKKLATERAALLDAVASEQMTLTAVVEAFVRPMMAPDWPGGPVPFCTMLMRTFHEEPNLKDRVFQRYFAPTRNRFLDALHQAAPDAPAESVQVGFLLLLSLIIGSVSSADNLPAAVTNNRPVDDDFADRLIAFGAAGLAAHLAPKEGH
jgi:AcrR family transcriptional regulator